MPDQKIENVLNLALDATEAQREKSLELNVGYNPIEREWDVIVKYSGSLDTIREMGIIAVELSGGFAIVTLKENQLEELARNPQIEYIEKPKRLFFQVENGKRVSCIPEVQRPPLNLFGAGVLVAVIDSGIDYTLDEFRNVDGSTRIRALWDQTIPGNPPRGYVLGSEYEENIINEALEGNRSLVPSVDISGHGTAVAGVAAGSSGVASGSELLIVKLGSPRQDGFPRTTELMQAIDYVVKKALEYQMPVAINLSFGNTYGAHDGTSLLERFIDHIANVWKNVICIGTGNEGAAAGHFSGRVNEEEEVTVSIAVQESTPALNLQIWKAYQDEMDISIVSPSGVRVGPIQEVLGSQRFTMGQTELLLYYGEPSPYSIDQEIYIDFLPVVDYINAGIWQIVLTPRKIVTGRFAMWLPSEAALNVGTAFLQPSDTGTLTIPSTAQRTIGVGAYDALTLRYASFSGRGQHGIGIRIKPDLVAPGVNVLAPTPGGTYAQFNGTSFATPFVTGGAALLMEWGIVQGNDPFLYGEKVKAYLQRGAKPFPGESEYPNSRVGYGALCIENSIP